MSRKQIFSNPLIARNIFSCLELADIKTVTLVCKDWKIMVEVPRHWTEAKVKINPQNMKEILKSQKIRIVGNVELVNESARPAFNAFFKFVATTSDIALRSVVAHNIALYKIAPDDLAAVVSKMKEVKLKYNQLTFDQVNRVFKNIKESSDLKLRTLDLSLNDLSVVPPETLASAVCRLEDFSDNYPASIYATGDGLTAEQLNAVFREITQCSDLGLRRLSLYRQDLSEVSVGGLVATMGRLEKVNIANTHLTTDQLDDFFNGIIKLPDFWTDLKLRNLDISSNNLSTLAADTPLEPVVQMIEEVDLSETSLTTEQLENLFHEISNRMYGMGVEVCPWRLKRLNMRNSNLDEIEPETLADAVPTLEAVDFSKTPLTTRSTNLTAEQLNAVYAGITKIGDSDIKLKKLNLSGHAHDHVSSDTLASAVCRVEEVDLRGTWVKKKHLDAIFSDIKKCGNLKLKSLNLSEKAHNIPKNVLPCPWQRYEKKPNTLY